MNYKIILPGQQEATDIAAEIAETDETLRDHLRGTFPEVDACDVKREKLFDTMTISFIHRTGQKGARDEAPENQKRNWLVHLLYTHLEGGYYEAGDLYQWHGIVLNATPGEALAAARKHAGITVYEDLGGAIERVVYSDGDEHEMSTSAEEPQQLVEDLHPLDDCFRRGYLAILTGDGESVNPNLPSLDAALQMIVKLGYPEVQIYTSEDEYFQVEFDESYFGGNYHSQGEYALVPFHLITTKVTPEEAFELHTRIDRVHVVNINTDDVYDNTGTQTNEELGTAFELFNRSMESATIFDALSFLSGFCHVYGTQPDENTDAWQQAEAAILKVRKGLATLHAPTPALLKASPDEAKAQTGVAHIKEILGNNSVNEVLEIIERRCCYFAHGAEQAAPVWIETRDLVRQARETIAALEASAGLNY